MEQVKKIFEGRNRLYGELMAAFAMMTQYKNEMHGNQVVEKYRAVIEGIFTSINYFTGVDLYFYKEEDFWVIACTDDDGEEYPVISISKQDLYY